MSLPKGTRLGPFEIGDPLGAGGMGEVYRAHDARLGRDVAVKVLPPSVARDAERLARFQREAQVLASLNHPSVGAIYGVENVGGTQALVLELVEGPTLADRIAHGPLPIEDTLEIARQIADALEYAHERGIVHRDLKPANVKLAPDGRVKVLDFGLAKAVSVDLAEPGDPSKSPTVTSLGTIAGAVLGTAAYMSPEQARGSTVDRRADIWAFGAVVWEMLTGRRPFEGETISDTLASVLRAPIEWDGLPPATPAGVRRLLKRCLERDPRKRLRDIGEARIALENMDAEPEPLKAPASVPPSRRGRLAMLPWGLFVLAVAAAGMLLLRGGRPTQDEVLRFEITPDPKLVHMTWPRVSPDGRNVAFLGTDATGKSSIWIRPIDAFAAFPLTSTEGASRPFWSPDSRYVAYFQDTQLKKAPIAGGPAQLVCETDGGADGAWGAEGVIVFDGRISDPLRRVAAAGGLPTIATHPDTARGEIGHAWPFFLPDGKHFLYVSMPRGVAQAKLCVGKLGDPEWRMELVPADSRAEFANGRLVYVLQSTLVAQAFDPETMEIQGEPQPLAENVPASRAMAELSVSTNGVLAFSRGGGGDLGQLVWVDRSGTEIAKVGEPDNYRDVALSPDDSRLAYDLEDPRAGATDIWVRDLKRDVASRLTFDPRNDIWPVWSPDGRRIVFASNRGGQYALWSKAANGTGGEEGLYADPGADVGPCDWSADGKRLLLQAMDTARTWDLRVLPMNGEPEAADYLHEKNSENRARFSPDGHWVAYASNETGAWEIYVQPYPAAGGKWQISNGGGSEPLWRADGKELFFRAPDDQFFAVPVATGTARFEPGIPTPLFRRQLVSTGVRRLRWAVSADGQRFLLNSVVQAGTATPFSVIVGWPATLD